SAIHCMLELTRQHPIDPEDLLSIEADVTHICYKFTADSQHDTDREILIKEQADHSLAYLLAVALLDGDVTPEQFTSDRINRADAQRLLRKVTTKPNREYTQRYPQTMPAKITVRLKGGKMVMHEVQDYPGLASRPFTWDEEVEKFDKLVSGRINDALSKEIKNTVRSIEHVKAKDLMQLLSRINATDQYVYA
ncbi:MAG TPA: hypothetical protein VK436_14990, partial [Methanocella sp.]|nr:hypothetical protein [Methanocella sp.]